MSNSGEILVIGVNYKSASVEIREKINPETLSQKVSSHDNIFSEWAILSTCNRTEIYTITTSSARGEKILKSTFPVKGFYLYSNKDAVEHLYSVAAGLDSMVLGESEIQSQIKKAYQKAVDAQSIGTTLHQLFKETIRVSKYIRNKTQISKGVTSLAQSTLILARKQLKTLYDRKIVLIGAGDIVYTICKSLHDQEIANITVVNRTYKHAALLVSKFGGKAVTFDMLPSLLVQSDLVISAVASPKIIISHPMLQRAMEERGNRLLCLIDLAVPRNIEVKVSKLTNVLLFDIDDMQKLVNTGVATRKKAADNAKKIIKNEVEKFLLWNKTQKAVPVLKALTKNSAIIRDQELTKALNKLSHVSIHDKKIIATLAKRLESKLLARLIANLKQVTKEENAQEYLSMIGMLFEL